MSYPVVRHWRLIPPNRYKYLWMVYITGIDLSQHCQNCLLGMRSKKFSKGWRSGYTDKPPIELNEYTNPYYYYICGGSWNFDWNLHLALTHSPGKILEYRTAREIWIVENVERIEISESFVDPRDPNYGNPEYRCRNWWFAHYAKRRIENGGNCQKLLF